MTMKKNHKLENILWQPLPFSKKEKIFDLWWPWRFKINCNVARLGLSTDPDATGLLQRTPWWGTKVSPQPVVSHPAGCSSFDSAASLHQQCWKWDSYHAALAGCSCESNFQAVLARSSVSSWDGSALPRPLLHTGQLYCWTHTSPFGCHGHVVCAQITDVNNWTLGFRHLLPFCMEQSPGRSSWSLAQPYDFQTSTQDLFVQSFWLSILLAARAIGQLFLHCICLWMASGFCNNFLKSLIW